MLSAGSYTQITKSLIFVDFFRPRRIALKQQKRAKSINCNVAVQDVYNAELAALARSRGINLVALSTVKLDDS